MKPIPSGSDRAVSGQTLFSPNEGRRAALSGPPADVLRQAARRLYVLALLYAVVFFLAGYFPSRRAVRIQPAAALRYE